MHRAWFVFVVGNINGELPDQGHLEPDDEDLHCLCLPTSLLYYNVFSFIVIY